MRIGRLEISWVRGVQTGVWAYTVSSWRALWLWNLQIKWWRF